MAEQTTVDQAEAFRLAALIAEVPDADSLVLARHLLAAGYRRIPEPEPVRWGECRACEGHHPLNEHGTLDDHSNERGRHCLGSHLVPLRLVDPPQGGDTP